MLNSVYNDNEREEIIVQRANQKNFSYSNLAVKEYN